MSMAKEGARAEVKPRAEPRSAVRPKADKASEPSKKKDVPRAMRRPAAVRSDGSGRLDLSADGSCSSDSSSSRSSGKEVGFQPRRRIRPGAVRSVKVVPEVLPLPSELPAVVKRRCTWITASSEKVYVSFHDEEWGVPVHDDRKLFEFLIFSEALAELSWPSILNKRDIFQKLFDNFDPASVATFPEKKILSLKSSGCSLLSEQKLRAVVENARQIVKVIQEFGSFSRYCWSFVNHRPISNGFRYARQVPAKTPKAESMSKDMMQRGFRCVGPTVIYSFMQAAGIVNDHLSSCFRREECTHSHPKQPQSSVGDEPLEVCRVLDRTCSLKA